jgi:hypothetical protein
MDAELENRYNELIAQRKEAYETLKPITKEIKEIEKTVKSHMRENELDTLEFGGNIFSTRTASRVSITADELADLVGDGTDITNFIRESSSISKRRRTEPAAAAAAE